MITVIEKQVRRLGGRGEDGVTVEWTPTKTSDGTPCWAWVGGGVQYGGLWPRYDDREEALRLARFEWETRVVVATGEGVRVLDGG